MLSKLIKTVETYDLIHRGDTVITALSGGADSVSLLFALDKIKSQLGFELKAAHINHNIRGEEALRDENFCKKLCENLGIEIFIKSINIPEIAEQQKISLEAAGRNERYSFFEELSKHFENAKIATAHTASDNLETVLFNLTRGAWVDGLCGIPVRRNNIIRPLIEVTRGEVESFCRKNDLPFVTDSTNNELIYTRNKLRNAAVPVLKEINPSVERAVTRMSQSLCDVSAFITSEARNALKAAKTEHGYSCEKIRQNEKIIREKMFSLIAKEAGISNLEKTHIDLCGKILYNNGAADLPGGFRAISKQGVFRIVKTNDKETFSEILLEDNLELDFAGKHYSFSFTDKPSENTIPLSSTDGLILRTRRERDSFRPAGRGVTKSIKKLLNEQKIPSEQRDHLLLIEQSGRILWLENIGISDGINKKNIAKYLKITINHHISGL